MSAYIVDNETINKILNVIRAITPPYDMICDVPLHVPQGPEVLGHKLLRLNYRAVNARYSEKNRYRKTFEFIETIPYRDHYNHGLSKETLIEAYKALRCLQYQCAEGNVPNMTLFKQLGDIERRIGYEIVRMQPEYERAMWG